MAKDPVTKAIEKAQKAYLKTAEGQQTIADALTQSLTPETLSEQIRIKALTPEQVFTENIQETNKTIIDTLKDQGQAAPVYVPTATTASSQPTNYLALGIAAVIGIAVLFGKKVRL